jgi:hypothetical protein
MLKKFQKFEKHFYKDGIFDKKIFEQYWGDYGRDDDNDWNEWDDPNWHRNIEEPKSRMLPMINFEKLILMGLIGYRDIVETCIEYLEKQISVGSYGKEIIPSLDTIKDYIIATIGVDYKEYISEEELDNVSRFIYQEIDNYIYD